MSIVSIRERNTITKDELLFLLTYVGCPTVRLPDGRVGYLESIQREDGSGRSFNLNLVMGDSKESLYVKLAR